MGDIGKHFNRDEFACNCKCGFDTVDVETIAVLDDIRENFDSVVRITSGCRCATFNEKIGGAKNSQHVFGRAADIMVLGVLPEHVYDYIDNKYPDRYGFGSYNSFTHIDTRSKKARWVG